MNNHQKNGKRQITNKLMNNNERNKEKTNKDTLQTKIFGDSLM